MKTSQSQKAGSELINSIKINGTWVDVYGCWDETTPDNEYAFYDLFVKGDCINIGSPLYSEPTEKEIKPFVK